MRVVIVGAGVVGTAHAWQAVTRGHQVLHLNRSPEPRGGSVRGSGLVAVSTPPGSNALDTARRGRELWDRLAGEAPRVRLRRSGCLIVARTLAELDFAREIAAGPDAADRGLKLLETAAEVRAVNRTLRGDFLGALWCEHDAVTEPRAALAALRNHLAGSGRYTYLGGREVRALVGAHGVRDDSCAVHRGDAILLCTGAETGGLVRELCPRLPVRLVRTQLLRTEPVGERLPTSVADMDCLRTTEAFVSPRWHAPAVDEPADARPMDDNRYGTRLTAVQRPDGGLTVGEAWTRDEPFPPGTAEAPYDWIDVTATALLGRQLPRVAARWAACYVECADPTRQVHRERIGGDAWLITGTGPHGMVNAPAVAAGTADLLGL